MEQVLFFSRENLQTGQIVYLCTEYINCLQESVWLLKQKFWTELTRRSGWLSDQDITQALKKQHHFFSKGLRVHLGEILLRHGLLNAFQLGALLEKTGISILFCPSCRLYFCREIFLPPKEQLCPECDVVLSSSCDNRFVKSALRTDFCKPILLAGKNRLKEEDFLFTELAEYTIKDLAELEQETSLILQSCDYWIAKLLNDDPGETQETFVDGFSQESMAVTGAISQKLLSLDISSQTGDSDWTGEWELDIPDALVSVFWGYMHNLQELLWLFKQRAFAEISQQLTYLNIEQLQQGIAIQLRALRDGRFLHLGQVLLQTYLLNEEQVVCVLREMGERVFSCGDCGVSLLQSVQKREPLCPKCEKQCKKAFLAAAGIPGSLATGFSPFSPLLEETACSYFAFYKSLPGYSPDFSGSLEEISAAWRAHSGESDESPALAIKEGKESQHPGALSSMEIKQFMESIDNIRSAEAIYDRYIDMNSPEKENREEKLLPNESIVETMISTGSGRNSIPTAIENLPLQRFIGQKAWRVAILFLFATALAWLLAGVLPGTTPLSLAPDTGLPKQHEQNYNIPTKENTSSPLQDFSNSQVKNHEKDDPGEDSTDRVEIVAKTGKIVGNVALRGQQIDGLMVAAVSLDGSGYFSVACDRKGHFSLDVKPGEYRLHLEQRNYRWPPQQSVWCYAGKQTKTNLELPVLSSIRGMVTIPAGGKIMRPALTLFNIENEQVMRRRVEISESGEFIAKHIDPGRYRVKLTIAGLPPIPEQEIDIAPGICILAEFKWDLGSIDGYLSPAPKLRPRLALYELVPDNEGWRIGYTPVKSVYPDEGGHFAFPGVKPGRYLILAKGESIARSREIVVDPYDSEMVLLTLNGDHSIEVRVSYKKRPLANAMVLVISSPYKEIARRAITDKNGHALLCKIPSGDYNILVEYTLKSLSQLKGAMTVSVSPSQKTVSVAINMD